VERGFDDWALEAPFNLITGQPLRLKDDAQRTTSTHSAAVDFSSSNYSAVMASAISFGDANAGFQAGIINGSANVVFNAPPGKFCKQGSKLTGANDGPRTTRDPTEPVDCDTL
jgi:hypothetical protein